MEEPKPFATRKPTRIPYYDYSSQNYYFVTICTHKKACIFGTVSHLNALGRTAYRDMQEISRHYSGIRIDHFVVMPNHVHAIVVIQRACAAGPTLSDIVGLYKSGVTRKIRAALPGQIVWQRSFHDHVIRSQAEYEKIWNYIEGNPQKWAEDCFYPAENQA